jgi:hypothetical protein
MAHVDALSRAVIDNDVAAESVDAELSRRTVGYCHKNLAKIRNFKMHLA